MTEEPNDHQDVAWCSESPWYVVYAKPRQESVALAQLLRQGYLAWLPVHTAWHRRGREWQKQVCPMFPRYLLMRPAAPEQSIGPVRSTIGVSGLVRFGNQFALMPDALVRALRTIEQRLARLPSPDESPFQRGGHVRFVDGPLKGLEGVVAHAARDRVAVLLLLLGRESKVAVAPGMLTHAGRPPQGD
ncbi:MAG: transcriptional activator RfaH [Rhodocyclales bacterium]|nr:transcriptional activator RfaH [Rhodocyclales bacterium]